MSAKVLDLSEARGYCDLKFENDIDRVKKVVRKGENAGNQHFLLFQPFFSPTIFSEVLSTGLTWQCVIQAYCLYEPSFIGMTREFGS